MNTKKDNQPQNLNPYIIYIYIYIYIYNTTGLKNTDIFQSIPRKILQHELRTSLYEPVKGVQTYFLLPRHVCINVNTSS